jgi:hypothetical protein
MSSESPRTLIADRLAQMEAERAAARAKFEAEEAERAADMAALKRVADRGLLPLIAPPEKAPLSPDSPYFGLGIAEACLRRLTICGVPQKCKEILRALTEAGFAFKSKDNEGTINWALRRRENRLGDVVLLGNATWGLPEWFSKDEIAKIKAERTNASGRDHDDHVRATSEGMRFARDFRGVKIGQPLKWTPEIEAKVKAMIREGMKIRHIAKKLEISASLIHARKISIKRVMAESQPVERDPADVAPTNGSGRLFN